MTVLFAIAVFTFSTNAQNQQANDQKTKMKENHGQYRGHDGKGMEGMDKLNLTDAQKQQIKSINQDFKNRLQALNQNDNILVKDAKAQRKALMEERKSKIAAILTPEQRTQFEQSRKEHRKDGDKMNKGEWKEKRKEKNDKEKIKVK